LEMRNKATQINYIRNGRSPMKLANTRIT
jgi:hypothetical protein